MTTPTIRDGMIHNAVESRRADETRIMAKVNAAHREGFRHRFPGAIEHSMRLINERLQHCLSKPEGMSLSNADTWPADAATIRDLCESLAKLESIRLNWPAAE